MLSNLPSELWYAILNGLEPHERVSFALTYNYFAGIVRTWGRAPQPNKALHGVTLKPYVVYDSEPHPKVLEQFPGYERYSAVAPFFTDRSNPTRADFGPGCTVLPECPTCAERFKCSQQQRLTSRKFVGLAIINDPIVQLYTSKAGLGAIDYKDPDLWPVGGHIWYGFKPSPLLQVFRAYPYLFVPADGPLTTTCMACRHPLSDADRSKWIQMFCGSSEWKEIPLSYRRRLRAETLICLSCVEKTYLYMRWCCECNGEPTPLALARAFWSNQDVAATELHASTMKRV